MSLWLAFTGVMAAQCSPAQESVAPAGSAITITGPSARASIPNGAVYLTLTNQGEGDDTLLKVETDAAQAAELHETQIDAEGVMRMRPLDRLPLPAGAPVTLEPGGKHIMLLDLDEGIVQGDTIRLTLNFEKAGAITIDVPVETSLTGEASGTGHGHDQAEHHPDEAEHDHDQAEHHED
jgi:copper(I)-binding protein